MHDLHELVAGLTPFEVPIIKPFDGNWPDTSTLNEGQSKAFTICVNALNPERSEGIAILLGNAGTGKSYLTGLVASAAVKNLAGTGRKLAIVAPTHKAKQICRMFSALKDHPAVDFLTMASLLAIREHTDKLTGEVTYKPMGNSKVGEYGSILLDEGSMVPEFQLKMLMKEMGPANEESIGLTIVGDPGQLPPVKAAGGVCPAFSKTFWEGLVGKVPTVVRLTEQMRSAEGAPIHAKALACRAPGGFKGLLQSEVGEHSWSVTASRSSLMNNPEFLRSMFDSPAFRENSNNAKVICYTRNASTSAANTWNRIIRQAIYKDRFKGKLPFLIKEEPLNVIKPLMSRVLDKNGGGNEMGKEPMAHVGETVRVRDGKIVQVTSEGLLSIGDEDFQVRYASGFKAMECLVFSDDTLEEKTINFLVPTEYERFRSFMVQLKFYATQGFKLNTPDRTHRWAEYKMWRDAMFIDTERSYALNVHRSQGSSYVATILDYPDLCKQRANRTQGFYVAASRAKEGQIVAI